MDPLENNRGSERYCGSPELRRSPNDRKSLEPRILFPDDTSSSAGGGDDVPFWKIGLAAIGTLILIWTFLKDPCIKCIIYLKEKYGPR